MRQGLNHRIVQAGLIAVMLLPASAGWGQDAASFRASRLTNPAGFPDTGIRMDGSSQLTNPAGFPGTGTMMDGPGQLTARIGGMDYVYFRNHNRSVVALTDPGGQVVEQVRYSNFGAPTLLDGNGQPIQGSGTGNPYAFRGMRYDRESGLYYCEQTGRPYDPQTGRFVCRGTAVGNPGNVYTFAGGNPWSGAERIDWGAHESAGGASGVIDLLNGGGSYARVNPSSGTTYSIRVSSFNAGIGAHQPAEEASGVIDLLNGVYTYTGGNPSSGTTYLVRVSGFEAWPVGPLGLSGTNGEQSPISLASPLDLLRLAGSTHPNEIIQDYPEEPNEILKIPTHPNEILKIPTHPNEILKIPTHPNEILKIPTHPNEFSFIEVPGADSPGISIIARPVPATSMKDYVFDEADY